MESTRLFKKSRIMNHNLIKTELHTRATEELDAEVKEELELDAPEGTMAALVAKVRKKNKERDNEDTE